MIYDYFSLIVSIILSKDFEIEKISDGTNGVPGVTRNIVSNLLPWREQLGYLEFGESIRRTRQRRDHLFFPKLCPA